MSFIRPAKNSVFGIYNPTSIKKLFQLRLGISQLKSHNKNHNFVDTTSDVYICNYEAENTEHFSGADPEQKLTVYNLKF